MAQLGTLTVKIGTDLTELNRGLGTAGAGVANLSKQVSGVGGTITKNLTAPIRESATAFGGQAAAVTKSVAGLGALRGQLTTVTSTLLGLNPAVARTTSLLGGLAIGAGPMIGILAGVAALAYGWNKLTAGAQETKKPTDEAIKSLEGLRDKQRLGSLSGTSARAKELVGVELAEIQKMIDEAQQRITDARRGGFKDPKA